MWNPELQQVVATEKRGPILDGKYRELEPLHANQRPPRIAEANAKIERSPHAKLPTDPFYKWLDLAIFERALDEIWGEPARRFPYFGPLESMTASQPRGADP
jgi:hypothetical protein